MERVVAYVDGFNLYFGLRSKGWRRFYWLDIGEMAEHLLKPGQELVGVKYFTSRVSSSPADPDQDKRQNTYLEALATLPQTSLYFGHYLSKQVECRNCGARWTKQEEKMTDVNIAMELLVDAQQDGFDTALLVSADSDLTGPVVKVRTLFPKKRVVVAFPPDRVSERLKREANAWINIGKDAIRAHQLPNPVVKPEGVELWKPVQWK
jgi:uncharacterized LabA/DUF88 family protein